MDVIDDFAPQKSSATQLEYYQWKCTDSRVEKVDMCDTVDTVFVELKRQLSALLLHTFVKRKQPPSFDSLKNFSIKATIAAQKEVQAAHWHHTQTTIFTSHAWINNATPISAQQ